MPLKRADRVILCPMAFCISVALGLATSGSSALRAQAPTLQVILARLGAYLVSYEEQVTSLVAEEEYEQWVRSLDGAGREIGSAGRRRLTADFLLVRLPNGQAWYGMRDVFLLNGETVREQDQAGRVEWIAERMLLGDLAAEEALSEATRIALENASYNLGAVLRTINVPLQALDFLHPLRRVRFEFRHSGDDRVDGRVLQKVDFDEQARPTLVRGERDSDMPAQGTAWVDPDTGAVWRTELRFVSGPARGERLRTVITVTYRQDERLGFLVPAEMQERYQWRRQEIRGRARYAKFRQFGTATRIVSDNVEDVESTDGGRVR